MAKIFISDIKMGQWNCAQVEGQYINGTEFNSFYVTNILVDVTLSTSIRQQIIDKFVEYANAQLGAIIPFTIIASDVEYLV